MTEPFEHTSGHQEWIPDGGPDDVGACGLLGTDYRFSPEQRTVQIDRIERISVVDRSSGPRVDGDVGETPRMVLPRVVEKIDRNSLDNRVRHRADGLAPGRRPPCLTWSHRRQPTRRDPVRVAGAEAPVRGSR